MTKSELIELISRKQLDFNHKDVELAVNYIIETMTESLVLSKRIEIRGFGSFDVRAHRARMGINPKTGESVKIPKKTLPHFKPGKDLKQRIDASKSITDISD